jgi:predicted exporter
VAAVGLARLDIADDVRGLVRIDPSLLAQQQAIANVLEVPSPAQFYILEAQDEESLLVTMERLTAQLDELVASGRLGGYQAPSQWVPSLERQRENRARVGAALESPGGPLSRLAVETGLDPAPLIAAAQSAPLLTVPAWLASPASAPLRPLWLGSVTRGPGASAIVLLKGLSDPKTSQALAAIALPGVRYIDKPAQISALLRAEGARLTWLLVIAYAITALVLVRRYGARSWRVLAPTLAATVLTLALHGLIGAPVQMITLIALFLLLGMGVDYGIFLAERPEDGRMFVSISLSALCTVLSFGLLAFSSTPALHAFGLATLAGTILVWLMAPTCRAPPLAQGQAR